MLVLIDGARCNCRSAVGIYCETKVMNWLSGRMPYYAAVNAIGFLAFSAALFLTTGRAAAEDWHGTQSCCGGHGAVVTLAQSRPELQAYDNYDLTGPEIRSLRGLELPACAVACQSESKCQAFSYDKWYRLCSLKQSVGSFRFEPRSTSGIAIGSAFPTISNEPIVMECFPGTNVSQEPYQSVMGLSFDQCDKACETDKECVAFVYSEALKACSLFRTADHTIPDPAAVSGVKHQLVTSNEKARNCAAIVRASNEDKDELKTATRGIDFEEPDQRRVTPHESASGLIFEDSDRRRLTPNDLKSLSGDELRIARNEIYARRGRYFQDDSLKEHFSRFTWYRPNSWDPRLNAIERANIALIQKFERQ
jgi:hypothetical protein